MPNTGPLTIAATGDSWFDYPLDGEAPGVSTDVIAQLRHKLAWGTVIRNLAHHGDATSEILGTTKRARFAGILTPATDAILFSGGGDDMVGDQFRFWLNDAASGSGPVNTAAFNLILGVVTTGLRDLVALRDSVNKDIPIFLHSYDFAYPNNKDVDILDVIDEGPWLYPSLHQRGWMPDTSPASVAAGYQIVKAMLSAFNDVVVNFAISTPNVIMVDTQGTLSSEAQWANELHPTPEGFSLIADKFVSALADRFANRPVVRTIA